MEEILENKEQLDESCTVNSAAAGFEKSNDEEKSGSLYGKFKDADSLYNGYKELEKEFTKKSQMLSELSKSIEVDNTNKVPIYQSDDWQSKLDEYLDSNQSARQYAKEIAKTIMQDHELACMSNCLDLAYNKVVASKYRPEQELVDDETFLNNYIYNNDNIKSKILAQYLSSLKSNTTPPLILKSGGESVGVISPTKPKSMGEAKILVEKMFK